MNDILPDETPCWQKIESTVQQILSAYSYEELRFPLVEKTELFSRSIGEVTDIVEKEMYTFTDRSGDSLSLRPEGTAGCVRAGIQHSLFREQRRFWYAGPMFRHERPQKGRYRQFHQIGVEAYGMPGPDIDAEMIFITARIWEQLQLDGLTLELNSLGTMESRQRYRDALVSYFEANAEVLDEDSQRRLTTNPLRILDSKNPDMREMLDQAPVLIEYLDDESQQHFSSLCSLLEAAGIGYEVNPRLVRGLDYYGRTVFEWTTDRLGAQGTVCAGGRYDALIEQLGGKPVQAVGFALGLERLVALVCDSEQAIADARQNPHAYMVILGEQCEQLGLPIAEKLRTAMPDLRLKVNLGGGSFKTQFKRADKSGAQVALILGEDELKNGKLGVKYLREQKDQLSVDIDEVDTILAGLL